MKSDTRLIIILFLWGIVISIPQIAFADGECFSSIKKSKDSYSKAVAAEKAAQPHKENENLVLA